MWCKARCERGRLHSRPTALAPAQSLSARALVVRPTPLVGRARDYVEGVDFAPKTRGGGDAAASLCEQGARYGCACASVGRRRATAQYEDALGKLRRALAGRAIALERAVEDGVEVPACPP